MQKVAERATVLYDLADSGYDAGEIRDFSSQLGHVPIIDYAEENTFRLLRRNSADTVSVPQWNGETRI